MPPDLGVIKAFRRCVSQPEHNLSPESLPPGESQQGAAIASNLNAVVHHQPPQPAQGSLRGTLIKLGQAEGAANLFDRLAITGRNGHRIR